MKNLLLLAFLVAACAYGQTVVAKPGQLDNTVQMLPGAIPTSSKCLVGVASTCIVRINSTPYVCAADVTATGQTVTFQDGQATPVVWIFGGQAVGAMGTPGYISFATSRDSDCRPFPYGVYIVAGGAGATGSVTIKY